METVTLTRKERIKKESAKNTKDRKTKIQRVALAGTVATSILLSVNAEKAFGNNKTTYVVQKGDTLSALANKYNVSVEQIIGANALSSEMIKAGQVLDVPAFVTPPTKQEKPNNIVKGSNSTFTVKRGDTLSSLAKTYNVSIAQIQKTNELTSDRIREGQVLEIPSVTVSNITIQEKEMDGEKTTNGGKIAYATYTVAPGDNLWGIAKKFNTSIGEIKTYNNMSNDMILIGQKLVIKQSNLKKTTATVVGAVDNFSVEFIIDGEPEVLQVAYGTGDSFERISGKKVELVYYYSNRPTLVSFKLS